MTIDTVYTGKRADGVGGRRKAFSRLPPQINNVIQGDTMTYKSPAARAHTDALVDRAINHLQKEAERRDRTPSDAGDPLPTISVQEADRRIAEARRLAFTSTRGKRPAKEAMADQAAVFAAADLATHHRIAYPDRGSFQKREELREKLRAGGHAASAPGI